MVRLLGVALVAALLLATGAAGREPLTKQEYLSVVRAVSDPEATERLFDDVVNRTYYAYRCYRICRSDTTTLIGKDWLRSERLLRRDIHAITSRFEGLRPPDDIAGLHAKWIGALRRCSASLRSLESGQKRFASGDFEIEVTQRLEPACVEPFREIIPAFEKKGYVFAPAS